MLDVEIYPDQIKLLASILDGLAFDKVIINGNEVFHIIWSLYKI